MTTSVRLRRSALAVAVALGLIPPSALASVVRDDIPYQDYRDFAENKGRFFPGATNIPVWNKNGEIIGRFDKAPMPDFSGVDVGMAVATLIHPQYITSVAHNGKYKSVEYGRVSAGPDRRPFKYQIVRYNNQTTPGAKPGDPPLLERDFHMPRLHKLVVEASPYPYVSDVSVPGTNKIDATRWTAIARLGSGTQYTQDKNKVKKHVADAYLYVTGGTAGLAGGYIDRGLPRPDDPSEMTPGAVILITRDYLHKEEYGPLNFYTQPGDSGSPLFFWDKISGQWVLAGVMRGSVISPTWAGSQWLPPDPVFIAEQQKHDDAPEEILPVKGGGSLSWSSTGITQGTKTWGFTGRDATITDDENAALDAGKNQTFGGDGGEIELTEDIHQGAGALTFAANYTVKPQAQQTWQGGGIIVNAGKTVDWQVNGVKDDNLHKLGAGTLNVAGTGVNPGGLRVGDGTVRLAQKADAAGNTQAFSVMDIVSGRPTVRLDGDNQIATDRLFFGYRGGRLDMNGHDLSFERVRHVDDGARLVNHSTTRSAAITLTGNGPQLFQGWLGETDPARHNGVLSVNYAPGTDDAVLAMTGGARLNGEFRVKKGTLVLSGRQVPHAYDHISKQDVIRDNEWYAGDFGMNSISLDTGTTLQMGRDVQVRANVNAADGSRLSIGEITGAAHAGDNTWRCTTLKSGPDCQQAVSSLPADAPVTTRWDGDLHLGKDSVMTLSRAHYRGTVQGGQDSLITVKERGEWLLTGDSTVASLAVEKGGRVRLSGTGGEAMPGGKVPAAGPTPRTLSTALLGGTFTGGFHTLTTRALSGAGEFLLRTDLSAGRGDRLKVDGPAAGVFTLGVLDLGGTADPAKRLTLATFNGDRRHLTLRLKQGFADFGNYRYRLHDTGGEVRLHDPDAPVTDPGTSGKEPVTDPVTAEKEQVTEPVTSEIELATDGEHSRQANDAISRYAGRVNLFSRNSDAADRRMARLSAARTGLYLEQDIARQEYRTATYRPFIQTFSSQSLGYDGVLPGTDGRGLYGVRVTRGSAQLKQDGGSRSQLKQVDTTLYGKWTFGNGVMLSGRTTLGWQASGAPDALGATVAGSREWRFGGGWSLTPVLGAGISHLGGQAYTDAHGNRVKEQDVSQWQWQGGVDVKTAPLTAGSVTVQPWGYAGLSQTRALKHGISVSGQSLENTLSGRSGEVRLGMDMALTTALSVDAEVGYRRGDTMREQRQAALNLRYRW
ncbi:autotransporter outer membrane beta-barrel domain-containing protein [Enterobacter quasiroggenkampii]|uniref:S6 family peptidase n=1 Tax=Enterobacter quasiroggenkampii TaxID=2497436 RepID=UPI0021D11721|nr:S6 family peptidase [Enterobacter quasiroggenkampii]MCU6388825.1 autotransporter outer membrane beta-barrel domain-containing protein [Enterobacter quasiroggenkampii]